MIQENEKNEYENEEKESKRMTVGDRVAELYELCRCGRKESYEELLQLFDAAKASSSHLSFNDTLVVKGYLGDLLLICKSQLIPLDVKRGKALLAELSVLDDDSAVTCPHLQHLLAVYYYECCTGLQERVIRLLKRSVDQGHVRSLVLLGYFIYHGEGIKRDVKKSMDYYLLAASKKSPVAAFNVGKFFDNGWGCEKDSTVAVEWYKKAASHGYAEAIFEVGCAYRFGNGVNIDYIEAARNFEIAVQQGHSGAQYRLAWCYHSGRGVERDDLKAIQLGILSYRQGDAFSAQFLGQAYEYGWGVEASVVEAMRYFRRAVSLQSQRNNSDIAYSVDKIKSLSSFYKEAVWLNRKSFLMFLWGCNFIYRSERASDISMIGTDHLPQVQSPNCIVHHTFYIHDIQYEIMGYL